jgi:hypothetical protein
MTYISISTSFMVFLAVILTAWHAGPKPALLTIGLFTVFFAYCCMPPMVPISDANSGDLATLVFFVQN